jgi:hypothetical protein
VKHAYLVTSGDLRQSANEVCWPAQSQLETALTKAELGIAVHFCGIHLDG